jgi:hypothetical protein
MTGANMQGATPRSPASRSRSVLGPKRTDRDRHFAIAVGRGNHTHVDVNGPVPANAFELALQRIRAG